LGFRITRYIQEGRMKLYRLANKNDAKNIVSLFTSEGNPYHWTLSKWNHYYMNYPEGKPVSVVALDNGVIGHYGMLPVRINQYNAMLGVHAFVKKEYRGSGVIFNLMYLVNKYCSDNGIDFICGFNNHNFAKICKSILKWNIAGYLLFDDVSYFDNQNYQDRYRFIYSQKWYQWKFGSLKPFYTKEYIKDGKRLTQLLKTNRTNIINDSINLWNPERYTLTEPDKWNQPFLIKVINNKIDKNVLDIRNWYIEMGDSDTFEYEGD
jgi:hypothetical protein